MYRRWPSRKGHGDIGVNDTEVKVQGNLLKRVKERQEKLTSGRENHALRLREKWEANGLKEHREESLWSAGVKY